MDHPSRRAVLGMLGAAGVGMLTGAPGEAFAESPHRRGGRSDHGVPLRNTFVALVGSTITLADADGSHRAVVESVNDLRHSAAGDELAYSLIVRMNSKTPPAGIYRISRHKNLLGSLSFVGVDHPAEGLLQAVINRRVPDLG